jgi:hypothetical protein
LLFELCGLLLQISQLKQCIISAALQGAGQQTIRGTDFFIPWLGKRGFILGTLQAHLPLPHHCLVTRFQFPAMRPTRARALLVAMP